MLHALITLAAAEGGEESSKVLFYVLGGLLAVYAVVISAFGIARRETFPASQGQVRGVIALTVVLMLAAMAAAVITG